MIDIYLKNHLKNYTMTLILTTNFHWIIIFLTNIITEWKTTSYRFKKECIMYDTKDYDNRLILREYRIIPLESESKSTNKFLEYIIWGNSENIMRLKASKHIFIDVTFIILQAFIRCS